MSSPKGVGLATTAVLVITSAAIRMVTAMTSIATFTGTRALHRAWRRGGNLGMSTSTVDFTPRFFLASGAGISGMVPWAVGYLNALFSEGYTGLVGLNTTEGYIGTGGPANLQAPASKSYVAFLPGAWRDLMTTAATVFYALPFPLVALHMTPMAMLATEFDVSSMPMITNIRMRLGRVSTETSVALLSALTSVPIVSDRACNPIERQSKIGRLTTGSGGRRIGPRSRARRPSLGHSSSPPSAVRTTSRVNSAGGTRTLQPRRPIQPPRAVRSRRLPGRRILCAHNVALALDARRRKWPTLVPTVT